MEKFRTSNSTEQPSLTPVVTAETCSEPSLETPQKKHESELVSPSSEAAAPAGEPASSETAAQNDHVETKEEAAL